jgi:hypothetical protein
MRAIMVKYRYKSVCRGRPFGGAKARFALRRCAGCAYAEIRRGWADVPCANLIKRAIPCTQLKKLWPKRRGGVGAYRRNRQREVDFAEINDLYLQTVYSFYEMGGQKVWDKDRAAFVFDHYAPAPTIQSAKNHGEMREFAGKTS